MANGIDRKFCLIVIDADAHPPLVSADVIDAVGSRFALFLILKIVGAYWLRLSFPVPLPGRPGDFHPESPTDPDVNLSIHPARATPRKPAGFRQDKEFLRLPVDSILTRVTCPLGSTGITPLPR